MKRPTRCRADRTELPTKVDRGSVQEFRRLYAAFSPVVRSFLAGVDASITLHERQDIVQEAFLRVWKSHMRSGSSVSKGYLLGVARNVLREEHRRRRKLRIVFVGDPKRLDEGVKNRSSPGRQQADRRDLARAIAQALSKLPAAQRQAFVLVHVRHLTITEAARRANCSANGLYVRLHYARKRLKVLLNGAARCVLL